MEKPNLQQYFKESQEKGIFEHEVVATDNTVNVLFHIQPKGSSDGQVLNFAVKNNELTQLHISPEDDLRKYLNNVISGYPVERLRQILTILGH